MSSEAVIPEVAMELHTVSAVVPVPSSWLHTNLRSVLMVAITVVVCTLALMGNTSAEAGLIASFGVLIGHLYGERTALKKPGIDT